MFGGNANIDIHSITDKIFIKPSGSYGLSWKTVIWFFGLGSCLGAIMSYDSTGFVFDKDVRLIVGFIGAYIMMSFIYWDTQEWLKNRVKK